MILYMPTIALVNSVSFKQMKDPEKEFSNIRVFGTIGWIVAGLLISYLFHWDTKKMHCQRIIKKYIPDVIDCLSALGLFSFTSSQNTSYKKSEVKK